MTWRTLYLRKNWQLEILSSPAILNRILRQKLQNFAVKSFSENHFNYEKEYSGHRRVVIPAPGADRMKQQSLLRAIRNGQRWMEMLINGEAKNITDLAAKLGLKPPYVTRVLGLNNLAPDIVEAIVNGAEPDGLSIAQIMKNIPEDWNEQRRLFGFPER